MKIFYTIFLFCLITFNIYGQNVGINATGVAPAASSMLDVFANDKGVLIPRVALSMVNLPIPSPALSLLVYNTSISGTYAVPGFYYFNGIDWVKLGSDGDYWKLTGNSNTTPGTAVGQNFIGTADAKDFLIATNSTTRFKIKSNGSMRMIGDFENQDLIGNVVTWGAGAPVDPASATVTSTASAATLWVSTATPCASCLNTYSQTLATFYQQAEVIDGTVQSITINDGSGTDNSGVLVLASVSIKTITSGTLPNGFRYAIWLQRTTDPTFNTAVTNVYKTEDGIASGTTAIVSGFANIAAGASTTTIVYPDLTLAPGTYYYRLVFQPLMGSFYGLTPTAQDRSMVLLQIKR
jgi:hypothetical protein